MNRWSRRLTTSAGCRLSDSGVKSTTSANRIEAAANWSAIVALSVLSRSAIDRGRMFSRRVSARSCSTCSAASASSRWRTNCARSRNTTAPATVTLSAIIVLREPARQGRLATGELAHDPGDEEHRNEGDEPAHPAARAVEHEGAERGKDAPQADGTGRQEAAHERHRDRRGEQDVDQLDPQEPLRVAGAGEDRDRPDRDEQVQPGDEACRDAEGEVDRAPEERDREDQDGDEDEQRLAQPKVFVVPRISPDPRGAIEPRLGEPSECVHSPRA